MSADPVVTFDAAATVVAEPPRRPSQPVAPLPGASPALAAPPLELAAGEPFTRAEERRWLRLVVPFVLSAVLFGVAIATGTVWPLGAAIIVGPMFIITAVVYLALTSDANSETQTSAQVGETRD